VFVAPGVTEKVADALGSRLSQSLAALEKGGKLV
jgi:hypothetical protein